MAETKFRNYGRRWNRKMSTWDQLKKFAPYKGYQCFEGWKNVPDGLVSASRARREKLTIGDKPAAYVLNGQKTFIYMLFQVIA